MGMMSPVGSVGDEPWRAGDGNPLPCLDLGEAVTSAQGDPQAERLAHRTVRQTD